MPANTTPSADDAPPTDSLTDPEPLAERDDVTVDEATFVHDTTDHCAAGTAGRAIVGVFDADGALLVLEHDDRTVPILPNDTVDPGGDWADVARCAGEECAGIPVELTAVRHVRHVEHVLADDEEPHEDGVHVVYAARPTSAPTAADDPFPADCDWTAVWLDALPEGLGEPDGPEFDDVRRFLD